MDLSLASPSLSIVLILAPEAQFQERKHSKGPPVLPNRWGGKIDKLGKLAQPLKLPSERTIEQHLRITW
jgi:hypothetical protein